MKTRITKTLLDSWAYIFDCYEGCEEEAMESFIRTLNREPLEETDAIINGKAFENLVCEIAEDRYQPEWVDDGTVNPKTGEAMGHDRWHKWYTGAKKVAEIVKGGQWQVHVEMNVIVNGRLYWLHGFCDVVKAGVIYDIKFKNKSLGSIDVYGSYRNHSQHSAYLRCLPEAEKFVYLVSDGEDLYTEEYTRETCRPIEDIIAEFIAWLETKPELLKIYEEKWVV